MIDWSPMDVVNNNNNNTDPTVVWSPPLLCKVRPNVFQGPSPFVSLVKCTCLEPKSLLKFMFIGFLFFFPSLRAFVMYLNGRLETNNEH